MSVSVPGGAGEGTLIFSYIRRLGPFFGLKILNFNIIFFFGGGGGGGVQKNEYVFEVAAVGLYSSLKMKKTPLCKRSKLKMGLPCMFTQFSLCPAHSYFAQGLVIAKIDKIPLAQF